jgi:hypothetical protein
MCTGIGVLPSNSSAHTWILPLSCLLKEYPISRALFKINVLLKSSIFAKDIY